MSPEEIESKLIQLEAEIAKLKAALPVSPEEAADIRTKISELLKSMVDSKIAADEEARRAARAKEYCEEHATVIGQKKGQAETDLSQISSIKASGDETLRLLTGARSQAEGDLASVAATKQEFAQLQAWLTQVKPAVEAQAKSLEDKSGTGASALVELQKASSSTKQLLGEIEEAHKNASSALEKILALQQGSTEAATAATVAKTASEGSADITKKLENEVSVITTELQNRQKEILDYRATLDEFSKEFRALNDRVEGLLPHTAVASLASAFRLQKERFGKPQRNWLIAFSASIVLLVLLAAPSFYYATVGTVPDSWGVMFRGLALRLPILVPVVWFAIYSGKNYMLSVRIEEDYAYKEAVSVAFQGYAREMQKIDGPGGVLSPVATLCNNVLRAIAEPPGRIYDGKVSSYSMSEQVVEKADELRHKQVAL